MVDRMRTQLGLDEQQQVAFDDIVAAYRERLTSQAGDADNREIMQKLREARQNGDEETARQLREQLRASGGGREQIQRFFDDVEKILRDDQKEALSEMRDRLARAGGRMGGMMDPVGRLAGLREQLSLTPRQAATWDRLLAEFEASVAPQDGEPDFRPGARGREAGGDPERMREMGAAMMARRERVMKATDEFFAGLDPILTDEQRQITAEFREDMAPGGPGGGRGDRDNPRIVFQAARRLQLTREQREGLRQIEQETGARMQEIRRDPQALAALKADVANQVRDILTPEQVHAFDDALARAEARGGRPGGPRPGAEDGDQPRRRRPPPRGDNP